MTATRFEASKGLLFGVGLGLCTAGFFVPGSHASVAIAGMVSGTVLIVLAFFQSKLKEFGFGPGGFTATVANDPPPAGVAPALLLDVDAEKLNQFAYLVCGDKELARGLVEEVLARTRRNERRIPASEQEAYTLRSLIGRLKTVHESRWVRGMGPSGASDDGDEQSRDIIRTLQRLEIPRRVTFLLHVGELHLTIDEIAQLLDQQPETVDLDLQEAIGAVKDDVMAGAGPAHA